MVAFSWLTITLSVDLMVLKMFRQKTLLWSSWPADISRLNTARCHGRRPDESHTKWSSLLLVCNQSILGIIVCSSHFLCVTMSWMSYWTEVGAACTRVDLLSLNSFWLRTRRTCVLITPLNLCRRFLHGDCACSPYTFLALIIHWLSSSLSPPLLQCLLLTLVPLPLIQLDFGSRSHWRDLKFFYECVHYHLLVWIL